MNLIKRATVGKSWIAPGQPGLQAYHFLQYFPVLPRQLLRQGYLAMLIGKVTCIHDFNSPFGQEEEARNVDILDQRFADVVDLPSSIFAVCILKEGNGIESQLARAQVKVLARWATPDGVKFRLDEYTGPLPDGPAKYLFAAKRKHVLWNDGKAFALWLMHERLAGNLNGIHAGNDLAAEFENVGG